MALSDAVSSAVICWPGSPTDSVGSNDLTDNNTVGTGTGKVNANCFDFEATSLQYYSIADNADVSTGNIDFMWRLWLNPETANNGDEIIQKYGSAGNREYLLRFTASSELQFFVSSDGTSGASVTASNYGTVSTGSWILVHCWHDSVNDVIGISVNGGTANTTAHSAGVFDSGQSLLLAGQVGSTYYDGLMDDVVFLKNYILDSTERTEDYNSGTGVAFADWSGGGGGSTDGAAMYYYMMNQG